MDRVDSDAIKALPITLIEHALILGQYGRMAPRGVPTRMTVVRHFASPKA